MKYKINANQNGFTVIETIIAITILVTISSMLAIYINNSFKITTFIDEFNDAVEEAKKGVMGINYELREAINAENGSYVIESALSQEIIFYSDIDADNETERVRYYLDGADLKKGTIEPIGTPAVYNSAAGLYCDEDGAICDVEYDPCGVNGTCINFEGEVNTILSQYVQNDATPVFTYYDMNNNLLNQPVTPTDIRLVHSHLEINIMPERAPSDYNIESDVYLRNLKENY